MDSEIQELKNELTNLKKLMQEINIKVNSIEELEKSEIKDILLVRGLENKELTNLDLLKELENKELDKLHKISPAKFKDITQWKSKVWDGCNQKIMNESKRIVSFTCKLNNKVCSFENCPKNKINNDNTTKT